MKTLSRDYSDQDVCCREQSAPEIWVCDSVTSPPLGPAIITVPVAAMGCRLGELRALLRTSSPGDPYQKHVNILYNISEGNPAGFGEALTYLWSLEADRVSEGVEKTKCC